MGRPCTVCTNTQREAINAALAAGHSFRDIASEHAISKTTLHRHWRTHVDTADAQASTPAKSALVRGAPRLVKWGLWATGIVGLMWLIGRAGDAPSEEI